MTADEKILEGIEKALGFGITGWSSKREAANFFDVSKSTLTKERIEFLKSKGLLVSVGLTSVEKSEAIDKKILDGAERALKLGMAGWKTKAEAANFLNIYHKALTEERIEFLKSKGLSVSVGHFFNKTKEAVDKKILDGVERALRLGIKGWDSRSEAANFFDVSPTTLTKGRLKFLKSKGLSVSAGLSFVEKKEVIDKRILGGVERALRLGIKGWDSRSEAANFFDVSGTTLTEERIALIKSKGLEIKEKASVSPNTFYIIRKSEELGIKVDSPQALMELSLDFFSREIRTSDDILLSLGASASIMEVFTESEAIDLIATIAWRLIEDGADDFSIMELKLELFRSKIYFSADKIEACLKKLDMNTSELHRNTLEKRFRLAEKAIKYDLVGINYVDTLPTINNCKNRNIYIHKSIRGKANFINCWKQYAEIMMRENIGGSITRSSLPENLKIEEEINKNSARAKAYLVDNENIDRFKKLGYEGVVALILHGSRNAKNSMPRAYHSLAARLMGFFLYLSQRGLAVAHSRFLVYSGGEVVSRIAKYFTSDHVVSRALPGFISSSKSKTVKKFHLLSYKFASAVHHDADLAALSFDEINAYIESVQGENISGTLKLDSFCLKFLQYLGNNNAFKRKPEFNVSVRWVERQLDSTISLNALKWYETLIAELIEVIEFRYKEEAISENYVLQHIKSAIFLLEFLSVFDHKLNREEMIDVFNPIIKSKKKLSFAEWAKERSGEGSYRSYQSIYVTLFEHIKDPTYLGIYPKTWISGKSDSSERTLIRDGLELPVLVTYQDAILSDPFPDNRYIFLRSTPKGEIIDISSWWKYDFSPIPVVCAWLVSKLPRRGKHIRYLDADRFLVFNPDGTLRGLSFNTDKNKSANARKDLFIPRSLLVYAFSDAEMQLLISYTKYIQQAYSDRSPVKYDSQKYSEFMPLFPHHNQHDVLSGEVLKGYKTKAMIKTQIIVRHNARNGVYDSYYATSTLEYKREYLSTIDLVTPRGEHKVPESIEHLNAHTVNQCNTRYRLEQGVHNFRHAISTSLAHMGLSIFRVRVFTGHKNINTLGDVYMHNEEEVISLVRTTTSTFFDGIHRPADAGNNFIKKVCMPLVKSRDPALILEALKEHGFMSLPRRAQKGPDGISVDTGEDGVVTNGVEIASFFNPATWVSKSFGICPVGKGCPEESRGVCGLCPFLIFNASFVKGILLELNDAMNELAVFNAKNVESIRSASGDEVQKQVAQKISEVTGWNDMFSRAEAQLLGEDVDSIDGGGKSLTGAKVISKNLFGFRQVSIDESTMETLYRAMELELNDVKFDRRAKEIAWKMAMQCARKKDFVTLDQMEKDGLNQFIAEYGRMNFDEKKAFILEKLGNPQLASSSPLVQQKNTTLLELVK